MSWKRRSRRGPAAVVAGSLFVIGCDAPTPTPTPQAAEPQPAPPTPTQDKTAELWREPVTAESFARRTLYTWTTAEQIEALRRDRQLLVRERSPTHGASYYERVVHALAQHGDAIAALLDATTFAKSRFAWPAAWATREGWTGEQYGDQLVRVTLAPDALVLALATTTGAFTASDLAGAPVALRDVVAHPERIGAVYFVADASSPAAAGIPAASASYREYVLCNESMIAAWSVGAPDTADDLARAAAALDALATSLRSTPATPELRERFARARAFENPAYALDPAALTTIAGHLRATPSPPPFAGGGTAKFPGVGVPRAKPSPIRKRRGGTYGGTY